MTTDLALQLGSSAENDQRVRTLMNTDRLAALDFARIWSESSPNDIQAKVMLAWACGSTMDHASAAKLLTQCVQERPTRFNLSSLALSYFKIGNYQASMRTWFKVLEHDDRTSRDLCSAVVACMAADQFEFARALHFTDRWILEQPESLFCRYLLDQKHATRKAQARDALLSIGPMVDQALRFVKTLDSHHWDLIDNKAHFANLISSTSKDRPYWWPETYRWPEQADDIEMALSQNPEAYWIFKPSVLFATQGHRIGQGSVRSWVPASELGRSAIVQRYMQSPLLVEGRKFNIRLQISVNAPFEDATWLWNDGLVFISTSPYAVETVSSDRAAHLVNPVSGARDQLTSPIGRYPYPGLALSQFLELTFDEKQRVEVRSVLKNVASEIIQVLDRSGFFEKLRSVPNWRAFAPKFIGMDLSLDEQLRPWVFELERIPGWGVGSPSSAEVQTRFRRDWLPFVLGAHSSDKQFLRLC